MSEQQNQETQTLSPAALKEALDKSSSINRTLGLGFSVFIFIMALMVAATTDMDLFIPDSTFTFPLINLPLNIKYFFIAAPFVVLIMHYNMLYNLHQHSEKLLHLYSKRNNSQNGTNEATNDNEQDSLLMYPFLFNYALTVQNPLHSHALNWVIRITIFMLPLALLFFILIRFADYQSMTISTWHFAAVLLDIALIATHSRSIIQVIKITDDEVSDDYGWLDFSAFRHGKPRIKNFAINAVKFLFHIVPRALSTTYKYLRLELGITLLAVAYFLFFVYIMIVNIDRYTAHDSLISNIIPRITLPEEVLVKSQPIEHLKTLYLNATLTPEERSQKELEITLKFTVPHILKGRRFRYADLRETILTNSDLRGADLTGAFLNYSKLQNARLEKAKFQGAYLSEANLQGAELNYANLQYTNFSIANLQGADLTFAKIQGADFSLANLEGATFQHANLQGSDLSLANLRGADFRRADLQGSNLSDIQLQGADLRNANLQGAFLWDANLQGADFEYSNLQGAVLLSANLQGANLLNTNLNGIIFDATKIRGSLFSELSVDTLLLIEELDQTNQFFITDAEIDVIALFITDEIDKAIFKYKMEEIKARVGIDTLTLAVKIPNTKIYCPTELDYDSSFFFIRRRIAAQNKAIAQGMLFGVPFDPNGAYTIYKSLYTDLYQFLESNHPNYLEGFPFDEGGNVILFK